LKQRTAAGEVLPPSKPLTGPGLAPALGLRAGGTGFFIVAQATLKKENLTMSSLSFLRWLHNLHFAWRLPSKARNRRRSACSPAAAGYRPHLESLEDRLCPSPLPLAPPLTPADGATQARVSQVYGQLPLSFEANQGQTAAAVNFLSRGSGYRLYLTPDEAVLALQQNGTAPGINAPGAPAGAVLRLELVGGNAQAPAIGLDAQAGTSNYFIGNDPSQWHTGITNYGRVEYQNVYAGVNLVYYGNQQQLEYDFVVAAGANPGAIGLACQGVQSMSLDGQGNLVLHTAGGEVVEQAPVLYQDIGGVRQLVAGSYVLQGDGQVGFAVGAYDRSQALVIDPVLSYSTYLGGSSQEQGRAIAVDSAGNAYITGYTYSADFPIAGALQPAKGSTSGADIDAFVAKLNAAGTALLYSTYLGGSSLDGGQGIAVDAAGEAYVTGYTDSNNFPTKNALQPANAGGFNNEDAFVAKLNATGTALIYSTYLGGSSNDEANAITVDTAGNAYVTGDTASTNFPTKNPLQAANVGGNYDAFVTELNGTGSALVYSTYIGGSSNDRAYGIAVDGAGNAYVTGSTTSTNFPTKNALQPAYGGGYDAFVTKLNATGTALIYSTYLGGSSNDEASGIAVDATGNAYVTGYTSSYNFPTKNPLQPTNSRYYTDAFVAKLNAAGTALVYSTYLGGSNSDYGQGIAVDSLGNAYVTGYTRSTDFPTKNPLQANGGGWDAFVAKLNATGSALIYSTYLGGSGNDEAFGVAVDGTGNAYVTGYTTSTDFPTQNPLQPANAGSMDVFVTKISMPGGFNVSTPANVPTGSPFNITVMATDASGNLAPDYTGTVQFTSSDGAATLPPSYTFTMDDQGVHTFAVTLNTLGNQSLTVSDNTDPTAPLIGSSKVAVIGPATQFQVSTSTAITAGTTINVAVTATDALSDVAVYYAGTVSLTSTSATGIVTVLGSYTFTAADQGTHAFSITLTTAGTLSLTATDANGVSGNDPSLIVYAAAASQLVFTAYPASVSAGTPFSVTLAVTDAYGNVVTNYTGKVHFTDSVGGASLPKDYTFTASDQGVHTFTGLVLRTKGVQTLKVSDTHNSSIFGSVVVDVL
jgi:hypothetical protein